MAECIEIHSSSLPISLVLSWVGGTASSAVTWLMVTLSVDLAGTSSCWVSQVADSTTECENTLKSKQTPYSTL